MKVENVLISIIVPIYNMEKYIGKCIESVLSQTYQEFELILIDDGSKDKSLLICKEYAAKDKRIHVMTKQNGGVSSARNMGLSICNGSWIMFIDPDDYVEQSMLESLLSETDENTDIVSCCCQSEKNHVREKVSFFDNDILFDDDMYKNDKFMLAGKYLISSKKSLYLELLDSNYDIKNHGKKKRVTAIGVPWGKLYRTSVLKKEGILFDPDLTRMQDNIFNMFVFEKARRIKYIDDPLYIYNTEHIAGTKTTFDRYITDYYGKLLKVRYEFCRSRKLLSDEAIYSGVCAEIVLLSNLGQFTRNYTQTTKRGC